MKNKTRRVPSSIRFISVSTAVCLLLVGPVVAAEGSGAERPGPYKGSIPTKDNPFPKVSRELQQLQQQYLTYQGQQQKTTRQSPFAPQVKLMRTSGGYVVVDAIAQNSAAAL